MVRLVEDLTARFFGTRLPVAWERMTDGVSTVVYRAVRGDERFYLRILPEDGATFAPEVEAHRRALALGCRVPEVLHYETHNEMIGRSLMLTGEIPGRPLAADDDPATVRSVMREAGRDLARINSIPVEGFGWVDRRSADVRGEIAAEYPDLNGMLDTEYRPVMEQLPVDAVPGIDPDHLERCLLSVLEIVQDGSGSRLVHGDFDTTHIFVNDGQYSGIIDFGEIRGMPAFYDLGHHRMHDQERLPYSTLGWLTDGYNEISPLADGSEFCLAAWSLLIAARALYRGLQRAPDSQIVNIARQAIRQDIALRENQNY